MIRDESTLLSVVQSLTPAARNTTANGVSVDLAGFNSATVYVNTGVRTDGVHTPSLQDSPDGSVWTDVAAAQRIGSFVALVTDTVQEVAYIGSRRFIRVVMTISGATTGAVSTAFVVRGRPRVAPV